MIWVVLLILALVAFFGYRGLHTKHVSRCRYDERTTDHVPEAIKEHDVHREYHEQHAAQQVGTSTLSTEPNEPSAPQRGGPSLLYAERAETIPSDAMESNSREWQDAQDSLDFTAETATLSSDEVGTPANSSDYDQLNHREQADDYAENTLDKNNDTAYTSLENDEDTVYGSVEKETVYSAPAQNSIDNHDANTAHSHVSQEVSQEAGNAGIAAAGVAAAAAGIGIASTQQSSAQSYDTQNYKAQERVSRDSVAQQTIAPNVTHDQVAQDQMPLSDSTVSVEGIDVELGDTTYNDADDLDDNDELLDFGDLTADISEMLKELNLRETDSPRLEINQEEFQQLKTGEPGEVKHEKIENVAGKLRNMLQ